MKPACLIAAWTFPCLLAACGSKVSDEPASQSDAAIDDAARDTGVALDHTVGAGGSGGGGTGGGGTGGSETSRDGESAEDVATGEGDAEIVLEGGGVGGCTPLTDGSGFLTFQTSGGLDLDLHLGNLDSCNGYWKQGGGVGITYFVPTPPSDATDNNTAILNLDVDGVNQGEMATGKTATFNLTGSGHIWSSPDVCAVNITTNARVGTGTTYKVGGTVTCKAAVPEVFHHGDLVVQKLEFMIGVGVSQ
jgi:hypothetical protein